MTREISDKPVRRIFTGDLKSYRPVKGKPFDTCCEYMP